MKSSDKGQEIQTGAGVTQTCCNRSNWPQSTGRKLRMTEMSQWVKTVHISGWSAVRIQSVSFMACNSLGKLWTDVRYTLKWNGTIHHSCDTDCTRMIACRGLNTDKGWQVESDLKCELAVNTDWGSHSSEQVTDWKCQSVLRQCVLVFYVHQSYKKD